MKTFVIKVGDTVFKKQMKNESRKGGKMELTWIGPYRCIIWQLCHCKELLNVEDSVLDSAVVCMEHIAHKRRRLCVGH